MTLDAGGTNFVFSAMRGGDEIVSPIRLPAVVDGFHSPVQALVEGVAVEFVFGKAVPVAHGHQIFPAEVLRLHAEA